LKHPQKFPSPVLFYDPHFVDHVSSPLHVERPERLKAIVDRLREEGLFTDVESPTPAELDEVRRVHRTTFLEFFQNLREGFLDPETAVHPETWDIALLAAGATLDAARWSVTQSKPSVALVRPPGHHAGPDYGGGFCYLNNVAIAAADQVTQGRKVAILDYDAHHGNGTSEIFSDEAAVLYISTHQYGIYPGTGAAEDVGKGEGRGYNVNIPFTAGCGDTSFFAAYDEIVEPIVKAHKPDVILVSLGVDAHYRDPLTGLALSSPGYVDLMSRSATLAQKLCGGRFVVALEGGYHLHALAEVIAGVVARLRRTRVDLEFTQLLDGKQKGRPAIEATKRAHKQFWNLR
jgi:acetoin utilization deacetylase AcuC-like enzyme